MSLLELGGRKFTIPVGEVALGSDAACAIPLTGADVLPRHALFQGQPDGQVVIRKAAPAAEVLINGVRLGAEPTPLLHGDKVEVGGHELTFVDERRSGSTQFIQKLQMPEASGQPPVARGTGKPGVATNTGGRVVSLTDGREYVITAATIVFGREAGCDIVVAGKDVSRRHAEIMQTPKGYVLVDSSTNGTFVNEERVQGQRVLQRADVIRMGDESFRFYADVVPAAAPDHELGAAAAAPPAARPQTGAPVRGPAAGVPPAASVAPAPTSAPAPALSESGAFTRRIVRVSRSSREIRAAGRRAFTIVQRAVAVSRSAADRHPGTAFDDARHVDRGRAGAHRRVDVVARTREHQGIGARAARRGGAGRAGGCVTIIYRSSPRSPRGRRPSSSRP